MDWNLVLQFNGKTMKFEEAIKIVGKEYIQEFLRQEHKEAKLPIGFRIKMWWMFRLSLIHI